MPSPQSVIKYTRLAARVLSGMLFILWGSFFIDHLEWFFTSPSEQSPPMFVWVMQSFHLLLLVGYGISLKWEKVGSAIVVVSAVIFFTSVAKTNAIPFVIVSCFPVLLFMYCWMKEKNSKLQKSE